MAAWSGNPPFGAWMTRTPQALRDSLTNERRALGARAGDEELRAITSTRDDELGLKARADVGLLKARARSRLESLLDEHDAKIQRLRTDRGHSSTEAPTGPSPERDVVAEEICVELGEELLERWRRAARWEWQGRGPRAGAAAAVSLLVLVVAIFWAARASGATAPFLPYAVAVLAVGCAILTSYYALSDAEQGLWWWALLLGPPLVLAVAIAIIAWRSGFQPNGQAALALTLVLVLVLAVIPVLLAAPGPAPESLGRSLSAAAADEGKLDHVTRTYLAAVHDEVALEAATQSRLATRWATVFFTVGGLAAVASGAAGVTGLSNDGGAGTWIAIAALVGAALTALVTALNPARRWEQASLLERNCRSLAEEIKAMWFLDLTRPDALSTARGKIEEISVRFDTMRGVPDRPRLWSPPNPADPPESRGPEVEARSEASSGSTDVDEQPSGDQQESGGGGVPT